MRQQLTDTAEIEYVQLFDSVPGFWQYIRGLRFNELVAELVQNELDANSTYTQIKFGFDQMICEGNGDHVDEDGWKRLAYVTGAGDQAPPKKKRIGIKNHGLKVCFTIGDEINVKSDNKLINQTLYMNGIDQPPSPGTYPHPIQDENTPKLGCTIEVPYRHRTLTVGVGEPFEFDPLSEEDIEKLFLDSCQAAPWRFIGALRPDVRRNYVLELNHHRLGTTLFQFRCGRMRKYNGLRFYRRICQVSGDLSALPEDLNERCCLFEESIPESSIREVPEFYSAHEGYYFAEVSWKINNHKDPVQTQGHRRYPIAYAGGEHSALTQLGFHFSGPYISDLERHGAIDIDRFNGSIDNACKSKLIAVLRHKLIPQYGAHVMKLLIDPLNPNEETLRDMTERMLNAKVFPLVKYRPSEKRTGQRIKVDRGKSVIHFGPRKVSKVGFRRLVIPMFTWENDKVSPLLALLCPVEEDQIDPSVPGPILKLLGHKDTKGWCEDHITFDENDVIERFQPKLKIDHFPWLKEETWNKALGDPITVNRILDVLLAIYQNNSEFDEKKLNSLLSNSFLPDRTRLATPLSDLYASLDLPTNIPIQNIPMIMHPKVANHRIFKKKAWKRLQFTFNEFLNRANLSEADYKTRLLFWQWLKKNWKIIPNDQWGRIAELPVWPDKSENLWTISQLCKPVKNKIAAILEHDLRIPHPDVLRIDPIKNAKRGEKCIRSRPTESEVAAFISRCLADFPEDRALTSDEISRFCIFERNLTQLASERKIRMWLRNYSGRAVALTKSGNLRSVRELVRLNQDIKTLHLLEEDIIDRKINVLDSIDCWKPLVLPTSNQIISALKQDPQKESALLPRLQAYLHAARRESKEDAKADIIDIKCIPDKGLYHAPGELAFTGIRADYWGSWKGRISGKGLSADVQKVYRDVGVIDIEPKPETSHEFFEWLNCQKQHVLANHLACVIRHINHRNGPISWNEEYPDCAFIPVQGNDNHVQLISKTKATAQRGQVFIPDFDSLVKAIKEASGNQAIQLVILSHHGVSGPITSHMQQLGVKSLRDYASNAIGVEVENYQAAPKKLIDELEKLCTRRMSRELRKRLDKVGLDTNKYKIRGQWHDRLLQVKNVGVATSLRATFQVGRYKYTVPVDATFDEKSSTIWLVDSGAQLDELFYQMIAERIFENPPEFLSIVLMGALRRHFREESAYYDTDIEYPSEESEEDDEDDEDEGVEPGGTQQTHKGSKPDLRKNLPKPGKIPSGITGSRRTKLNSDDKYQGGVGDGRKHSKVEEIHILDLKQNQYAWHCQICLTERTAKKLAPVNSYVEIQENRGRVIRAHHCDQVHAGGARHAGNILVLCNYHHRNLGDAVSRQDIIEALKETMSSHAVVFQTSIQGRTQKRTVDGKIITIKVPLRGETIRCFFTDYHANYWLKKAP